MRVGLVRNAAVGMVALVGLGLVGCDDDPTDFGADETVRIVANPSAMTLSSGVTTLLSSRTQNDGNEPTWEDITASVDATCGNATVVIETAASYEPSIQPPGQFDVTGGSVLGSTCITLTGGGVETVVEVTVVGDSLAISGLPDGNALTVLDTVNLSASLISADGSAVGPFDPETDVVWSSDDEAVLAPVGPPAPNGTFAAVGSGAAVVTATWTDGGVTVSSSETITVDLPPPDLTSLSPTPAELYDLVTITGTGMIVGAHTILLDGIEVDAQYEPMIVNSTTATFLVPNGGPGDLVVTVGVAGAESNELTLTRECVSDDSCATEPGNDTAGGAATGGGLPLSFSGYVDGTDHTDLIEFTLGADATFDILLSWTGTSGDLDVVFTTTGATDYSEAACGFVTATGAVPESGSCTLTAGTYYLWVESYDGGTGFYDLTLTP